MFVDVGGGGELVESAGGELEAGGGVAVNGGRSEGSGGSSESGGGGGGDGAGSEGGGGDESDGGGGEVSGGGAESAGGAGGEEVGEPPESDIFFFLQKQDSENNDQLMETIDFQIKMIKENKPNSEKHSKRRLNAFTFPLKEQKKLGFIINMQDL